MRESGEEVTLIILTYSRPGYLRELLSYLRRFERRPSILVADGSPKSEITANREIIEESGLEVEHAIYPEMRLEDRLCNILERIGTPYSVLCGDDDFVNPAGVIASAQFLEEHSDYSIAQGVSVVFTREDVGVKFLNYPSKAVHFEHPGNRLLYHLRDFTSTYYAVHRREQHLTCFREASRIRSSYRFQELYLSSLEAVLGKIGLVERPYLFKRRHDSNLGSSDRNWNQLYTSDDFSSIYAIYREGLTTALLDAGFGCGERAREWINRSFLAFMSFILENEKNRFLLSRRSDDPMTLGVIPEPEIHWNPVDRDDRRFSEHMQQIEEIIVSEARANLSAPAKRLVGVA